MEQSKKKIIYVITKSNWGGAQRYVYDLATNLPRENFDIAVLSGNVGILTKKLADANIRTINVENLKRDISILDEIISFFKILKIIKKEEPDCLHLNSSKAAALAALAGRLTGIKNIIFTVHGWPFKESLNIFTRFLVYFASFLTALLSHSVIVVSKIDEAIGKRMWGVKNKIHYIPIGIEMPSFLERNEAMHLLEISRVNPKIVTIAELTPNKGIRYALEAMKLLKDQDQNIDYFIIGDGEEVEELKKIAVENNIADRVHFLGFIKEAPRYLKAFDLFLLPSIKEGMPYVLLEAQAAGLPIIATNVVNPEFKVEKIPAKNPHEISRAVSEMLKNKKELSYSPPTLSEMILNTTALY